MPEDCLKLERWQGPPHVNKAKQHETVLSFKVSLFIQFIQSSEDREFIQFVWTLEKEICEDLTKDFKTAQCTFQSSF